MSHLTINLYIDKIKEIVQFKLLGMIVPELGEMFSGMLNVTETASLISVTIIEMVSSSVIPGQLERRFVATA